MLVIYEFVDINEQPISSKLSLSTSFDNVNLDEQLTDEQGSFTTLSTIGRGFLNKRIQLNEIVGIDGYRETNYTYDAREIVVQFRIEDDTSEGFRERLNHMNNILIGSKKRLEFADEDAYFIATLESGNLPDENSNDLIGELTFLCSNPLKMKNEHTLNITTTEQMFEITGQVSTVWTSKTVFTAPTSQFTLTSSTGMIELNYDFIQGDVLRINYATRSITLNGNNIDVGLTLRSVWFDLAVGYVSFIASHATEITYTERYH